MREADNSSHILGALITGFLSIALCISASLATEVDVFQGRIDRLIYGDAYTTFGRTETEIRLRLGDPLSVNTHDFPNPHVSGTAITHIELVYQDLSIQLMRTEVANRDLLVRIVLNDPEYSFGGGIKVGMERTDLEAYLGLPWKKDESGSFIYGDSELKSKVILRIEDNRVIGITWKYYVD